MLDAAVILLDLLVKLCGVRSAAVAWNAKKSRIESASVGWLF